MSGFNASDVVEDMTFDFDSLAQKLGPEQFPMLVGVKGTIPEPSDERVAAFQRKMTEATRNFIPPGTDTNNPAAMAAAMANLPDDHFAKTEAALADAIAYLTQGTPNAEQIKALPYRHKRRFMRWVQLQVTNPES